MLQKKLSRKPSGKVVMQSYFLGKRGFESLGVTTVHIL